MASLSLPLHRISIIKFPFVCHTLPLELFQYECDNNDADPLAMTCRRCMQQRMTPKTNTLGSRLMCDAAERLPLEALVTCLRDLCSIHNRAWMVHKRFFYLLFRSLHAFILMPFAVVFPNVFVLLFISIHIFPSLFYAWLFHSLNNSVQTRKLFMCECSFHHAFLSYDSNFCSSFVSLHTLRNIQERFPFPFW